MAKNLPDQLDQIAATLSESLSRVGPSLAKFAVRTVIDDVGLEKLQALAADTGDAAIDDGDDKGVQEYLETQVKKIARGKILAAVNSLNEWANR